MGLSEAFAQGGVVRALSSEMVLGLSPHEWRGRKEVTPLMSVTDSKGSYDYLCSGSVSPSEDRRSAIDLAIIRENLSGPRMFLRWIDGKVQVADALTRLHSDVDLLRAVCQQAFTKLVEAPKIMTASRQEEREREGIPRVKSPFSVAGACGRYDHTCDTNAHRDLTRNTFLTLKTYHVIQPSSSRTSLRDQCFLCLVHISVELCYSLGFGTTGVSGNS